MAMTTHGHHIPHTEVTPAELAPHTTARCGGVTLCRLCKEETKAFRERLSTVDPEMDKLMDQTHYDEDTLFKVAMALRKAGLTYNQVTDAISEMQNAGILFRERA